MSQYKITKKRLAEIIKEEYESSLLKESLAQDLDKDEQGRAHGEMRLKTKKTKRATNGTRKKDLSKSNPNFAKPLEKDEERNRLIPSEILLKKNLETFNAPIAASNRPDSWQRCGWTRIWRKDKRTR